MTALRSLERPHHPHIRWTPEDQWHVTLRFFADVDPPALTEALALTTLPKARAVAGPAPVSLSGRVWIIPVDGLADLARAVDRATRHLDPNPPEHPSFRGHLTLARARRPGALQGLPRPPVQLTWTVDHVVAMRSELHQTGAVHHQLGEWSLPSG